MTVMMMARTPSLKASSLLVRMVGSLTEPSDPGAPQPAQQVEVGIGGLVGGLLGGQPLLLGPTHRTPPESPYGGHPLAPQPDQLGVVEPAVSHLTHSPL